MKKTSHNIDKTFSPAIDVLRILAICGTVFIHLVYPIYSRPDFLGGSTWWLTNLINTFSRVAIPFFIMLSGYLMIPKSESISKNLDRTSKRLLFPLLAWFLIYIWWDVYYLSKWVFIEDLSRMVFISNMYHLYFLVILAGLYLFLPAVRVLVSAGSLQLQQYIVMFALTSGILITYLQYAFFQTSNLMNSFTIWFPYLGYFLLGHLLAKPTQNYSKNLVLFGFAFLTTFGFGYLNVWLRSIGVDIFWRSGVSYFDEYLSPNVILMSITLFQLLLHGGFWKAQIFEHPFVRLGVRELAKASFAVYLIHMIVMNFVDMRFNFAIEFLQTDLLTYFVTRSLSVVALSFVIAMIIIRVPLVKKLFGEK